jgi:hypothetical protein
MGQAIYNNRFGFVSTDLNDSNFSKRENFYGNNLHTSRINFTLGYETLLSKYKVSPKMDF